MMAMKTQPRVTPATATSDNHNEIAEKLQNRILAIKQQLIAHRPTSGLAISSPLKQARSTRQTLRDDGLLLALLSLISYHTRTSIFPYSHITLRGPVGYFPRWIDVLIEIYANIKALSYIRISHTVKNLCLPVRQSVDIREGISTSSIYPSSNTLGILPLSS